MTADIPVLDGHMHLLTAESQREEGGWMPAMSPALADAARRRRERYEREQAVPSALPNDERAYPVYARAEALGIPVLFHFGVTLDYRSDLRYANPLDLHAVARDFPGLPLIVAHAGAGFFRETLFLAYHCANVYVDTSGSGAWMGYLPRPLTLREVLGRVLEVFGPDRVLFGSDSRHAAEGYRHWLLREHREALEALGVPETERRKVLGGNMARLLRLAW